MGSSSQPSHTSTTTEPPAFIQPFMRDAAQESQNLYRAGGPQYYPGNTVVPFSNQTEQALGLTEQRALNGSPVVDAAQNYATGILSNAPTSQFGAATNPALDATFNRAADQVQNRLQSSFAGSGRNIGAARPVAADELGDLAQRIYGGAYESERDRMASDLAQQRATQFSVAGMTPQLAGQDYVDLQALGGVGQQVEDLTGRLMEDSANRWDFNQNAPGINLDNYISRITGAYPGQSSTSTTPTYRNRTSGALGGALGGAGIASALSLSNPWTAALAIGGGLLGAYG